MQEAPGANVVHGHSNKWVLRFVLDASVVMQSESKKSNENEIESLALRPYMNPKCFRKVR
jgi:hypothetical protein